MYFRSIISFSYSTCHYFLHRMHFSTIIRMASGLQQHTPLRLVGSIRPHYYSESTSICKSYILIHLCCVARESDVYWTASLLFVIVCFKCQGGVVRLYRNKWIQGFRQLITVMMVQGIPPHCLYWCKGITLKGQTLSFGIIQVFNS